MGTESAGGPPTGGRRERGRRSCTRGWLLRLSPEGVHRRPPSLVHRQTWAHRHLLPVAWLPGLSLPPLDGREMQTPDKHSLSPTPERFPLQLSAPPAPSGGKLYPRRGGCVQEAPSPSPCEHGRGPAVKVEGGSWWNRHSVLVSEEPGRGPRSYSCSCVLELGCVWSSEVGGQIIRPWWGCGQPAPPCQGFI